MSIGPMSKTPKKSSKAGKRRRSAEVTKHSDALDFEHDVFRSKDPRKIGCSLKHSAEQSKRRKGTPYPSAMSMLNYHLNRGGRGLSRADRTRLQAAKRELRKTFGRPMEGRRRAA